jgi:hypothetical protein
MAKLGVMLGEAVIDSDAVSAPEMMIFVAPAD